MKFMFFHPRCRSRRWCGKNLKSGCAEFTLWEMGRYTSLRNLEVFVVPWISGENGGQSSQRPHPSMSSSMQHAISAVAAGWLKKRLGVPSRGDQCFLDYLTAFLETWPSYLAPRPMINALKRYELGIPLKNNVDAVLTVSDYLADLFVGAGYPREKILPIYFSYDSGDFQIAAPPAAPPRSSTAGGDAQVAEFSTMLATPAFEAVKYRPVQTCSFVSSAIAPLPSKSFPATRGGGNAQGQSGMHRLRSLRRCPEISGRCGCGHCAIRRIGWHSFAPLPPSRWNIPPSACRYLHAVEKRDELFQGCPVDPIFQT